MKALLAATGMAAVAAALSSVTTVRFWRAWLDRGEWVGGFLLAVLLATVGSVAVTITVAGAGTLAQSDLLPKWMILVPIGVASGMAAIGNWGARLPQPLRAGSYPLNLTRKHVSDAIEGVDDVASVVIEDEVVWRCNQVPASIRDLALCSIARACAAASRSRTTISDASSLCNMLLKGRGNVDDARAKLVPLAADAIRAKRIRRIPMPSDWNDKIGEPWPLKKT